CAARSATWPCWTPWTAHAAPRAVDTAVPLPVPVPVFCWRVASSKSLSGLGRIMKYEHHTTDDQVRAAAGGNRPGPCPGGLAAVFDQVRPQGLRPAPVVRHPGAPRVPQAGLPRHGTTPQRLVRPAANPGTGQGPRSLHPPEGGPTPPGKRGLQALLDQTVA